MVSISVYEGDIRNRPCDLLILKHADGFFGVDKRIAELVGFNEDVAKGLVSIVPGQKTKAKQIMFVGVGPLIEFGYSEIRDFGYQALALANRLAGQATRFCMPIHGPGYGLDEAEAFSSLVAGIVDSIREKSHPHSLQEVEIVELNPNRARRFQQMLANLIQPSLGKPSKVTTFKAADLLRQSVQDELGKFGQESEKKTRLFVAMPFKDDFLDEWEISIQEAAHACEIICERVDKTAFVGDILSEVRRRIEEYDGLIALLNEVNPNVFLELGYAWAKGKPTILVAKKGQDLPFDVKGQRCIIYTGIADLRTKLRTELGDLAKGGIFARRH
jgi:hypothetical protein